MGDSEARFEQLLKYLRDNFRGDPPPIFYPARIVVEGAAHHQFLQKRVYLCVGRAIERGVVFTILDGADGECNGMAASRLAKKVKERLDWFAKSLADF